MTENIPLPGLPRALAGFTGGPNKTYAYCYKAAVDGRIPVVQGENGRYSVERAKLGEIARIFGLTAQSGRKTAA